MIICPFCQTPHVDNTLFCDECGTYMLEEEKRETFPLAEEPATNTGSTNNSPSSESLPGNAVVHNVSSLQLPVVRLNIGSAKREIEIQVDKTIHIGRLDPATSIYPDIDLTTDNGLEHGISRRHSRLFLTEEGVFIEDLGSTNGTFINGRRLIAYLPEPLPRTAMIRLGTLNIEIFIR